MMNQGIGTIGSLISKLIILGCLSINYLERIYIYTCLLAVTVSVSTVPSFFETVTAETTAT